MRVEGLWLVSRKTTTSSTRRRSSSSSRRVWRAWILSRQFRCSTLRRLQLSPERIPAKVSVEGSWSVVGVDWTGFCLSALGGLAAAGVRLEG